MRGVQLRNHILPISTTTNTKPTRRRKRKSILVKVMMNWSKMFGCCQVSFTPLLGLLPIYLIVLHSKKHSIRMYLSSPPSQQTPDGPKLPRNFCADNQHWTNLTWSCMFFNRNTQNSRRRLLCVLGLSFIQSMSLNFKSEVFLMHI